MSKTKGIELSKKSGYEWINRNINENGNPVLFIGEIYDRGKLLKIKKEMLDEHSVLFYDLIFEESIVRLGSENVNKLI